MNKEQNEQFETLKNKYEMLQSNDSLSSGAKDYARLLNLADTDEDVAKRLGELGTISSAKVIAYGKEKGFVFTEEDMEDVGNEIFGASNKLSNDDLEQVAGGAQARTVVGAVSLGVGVVSLGISVATAVNSRW